MHSHSLMVAKDTAATCKRLCLDQLLIYIVHHSSEIIRYILQYFTMRSILGSLLLQFSLLIVLLNSASAIRFRNFKVLSDSADPEEFKTFFFNQTLDHFNYKPESYGTFQQRYYINSKYWGGGEASAPIFVFLGAEAPMNDADVTNGLLNENAARFHSLLLYIEHRYYGKSIPFGSREEAFKNASTLGYFNSAQALSDYAAIINHVKHFLHHFTNL
ncbi:hypothetical protein Tsubulata_010539, partial [Turnera subulata]